MTKKPQPLILTEDNTEITKLTTKLVDELLLRTKPSELLGKDGLFQRLKKQLVERVLASELEHDLGYSKHSKDTKKDDNRYNGSYDKTVVDENGHQMTISVPRDRNGEFAPQFIPKGVRRFNGFHKAVVLMIR